jgi:hypothetical protein
MNNNIIIKELLKKTSNTKITFLKDINRSIQINKIGKFKYHYIPNFESFGIWDFISKLNSNQIYTVIPILSMDGQNDDPYIILSKQMLLNHYSDPKLISKYLNDQLEIAINDFQMSSLENYHELIFKYKRIVLK